MQKILITHRRLKQKKRQHKRYWVRQIFRYRDQLGAFNTLFNELKDDREYFFRYLRMSPDRFGHLLSLVRDNIQRRDTVFRKAIPAEARLAITLRYLA